MFSKTHQGGHSEKKSDGLQSTHKNEKNKKNNIIGHGNIRT